MRPSSNSASRLASREEQPAAFAALGVAGEFQVTNREIGVALDRHRGLAVQMTEDILDGTTLWGHQGNAYGVISCLFTTATPARAWSF